LFAPGWLKYLSSPAFLLLARHRTFDQEAIEAGMVMLNVSATALYGPDAGTQLVEVSDSANHALNSRTATLDVTFGLSPTTLHDKGKAQRLGLTC
jgi:hypothetical protein